MILMYHKVSLTAETIWWVTADAFRAQMQSLKRFNVVRLSEYDPSNPSHVVITFDGVYRNVYQYAFPILKEFGFPFELFVIGGHLGGDNRFDTVEPLCQFCTVEEIREMQNGLGSVQWHTSTHIRMSARDRTALEREILVPEHLRKALPAPKNFRWFAYPHGDHDAMAVDLVRAHFDGALSVDKGVPNDRYQLGRVTVTEEVRFSAPRVSLVVANYNYGRYLEECLSSVINQSLLPYEVLLIDDCSTDESREVISQIPPRPNLRVVLNESNLGIVGNFNKAVGLTTGDYVAIIGADNRIRHDFVEKCVDALNSDTTVGIAYTDVAIFGPLGFKLAQYYHAAKIGDSLIEGYPWYHWKVSDPTEDALRRLAVQNFIHGSSMYRRAAFDSVGGYLKTDGPEDHNLFCRMIGSGWGCRRVPHPVLEYRQHSPAQANTVLGLQTQNLRFRSVIALQQQRIAELEQIISARHSAGAALTPTPNVTG
jgi:GT2 family glycosyltransferase/peptidoglycan/xylan/chitin deacetylase (PgdA/CDA1 family)